MTRAKNLSSFISKYVWYLEGRYFFLYKMAGVNPLHKTFYVMVLGGIYLPFYRQFICFHVSSALGFSFGYISILHLGF